MSVGSTKTGWILLAGAVLFGFLLFTLRNDTSFDRHPNEGGKIRWVIRKEWDFHHPLLMLLATERVVKVTREVAGFERAAQSVVEIGRGVIALFSAVAVALLEVLAWRRFGWLCGAGVWLAR